MSDNSCNASSDIVYSAPGVESLRTARANNNPDSFSTATNSLVTHMSKQTVPTEKKKQALNKYQEDFDVCKSEQVWFRFGILYYKFILFLFFRPTTNIGCYSGRQDGKACFLCAKMNKQINK